MLFELLPTTPVLNSYLLSQQNNIFLNSNTHISGLLQYLDLSHNQLVNVPSLKNNILLTSLELSANGTVPF